MTLVVVIIGLIVITTVGLILSLRKFDKLKEKLGDTGAYVPSSLSAILLALLTIYLPIYYSQQTEREDAKHLLRIVHEDVYQTRQDLLMFYHRIHSGSANKGRFADILSRNEIPQARIFMRILGSEMILKALNKYMLESCRRFEETTLESVVWLRRDSLTNEQVDRFINAYGAAIWKFEEILELYFDHLESETTDSAFAWERTKLIDLYIKLESDSITRAKYRQHPWREIGP